jgi:rifampicin phosphotransferase
LPHHGVRAATIAAHQPVFACMIGLIQGRIYYNLLNWYRLLALLPGFKANRQFMEQMMGVKESLPAELAATLDRSTWQERMVDRLALVRTVAGLLGNHFTIERRIRQFKSRLRSALGERRPDLATWRADELATYYRQLDRQLLTHWDAPLVNDFFAMIFFGLLRKLTTQWCGDTAHTLYNDLLVGEGGMISAEPAQQVRNLARVSAEDPAFVQLLRTGSASEIKRALPAHSAFEHQYFRYLEQFGDRCQDELKLESPTLYDDPLPLWRSIGQVALTFSQPVGAGKERSPAQVRTQAEERVRVALAGQPVRRHLLQWIVQHARRRVRDRENLRFERTRVFGRARQIFVELGRRFYAADALDDPRAIFYLTVDEILGFVDGTTTCTDLRGLAAVRQQEFARLAQLPPPAERFVTYGMVQQGNSFQAVQAPAIPAPQDETLRGIGCCPGVVRGRARVVANPLTAQLVSGDILVAERTDPSWIMIMPAAAGLLVERGSLLSHAAIVSRELGIPSIVSLTGVTRWLQDGDEVEFDGSTGVVKKISA